MRRAFLFVTAMAILGCEEIRMGKGEPPVIGLDLPRLETTPKYFESCEQIEEWKTARELELSRIDMWSSGAALPVSSEVATNTQEKNVDEADIVKSAGGLAFIARPAAVTVLSTRDWKEVKTLTFPDAYDVSLFAEGNRMVALVRQSSGHSVYVYKIVGRKLTLLSQRTFAGNLVNARLAEGQLLVVSESNRLPLDIECGDLQRPVVDDFSFTVTSIRRIDLGHPELINSTARVGRADRIYATNEHVYIIAFGFSWIGWDARLISSPLFFSQIVSKFDWRAAEGPRYVAAGTVSGQVYGDFAFREESDRLFVATTVDRVNKLTVLKENRYDLVPVGESQEFGHDETIQAVRYIDGRAYIVTFRRIDPIFVFELSDRPKLLAELEIPGFSSYLHSYDERTLLGVGYSAGGELEVSRFAIGTGIRREAVREIGGHSLAQHDHHAFYQDAATGLVTLPTNSGAVAIDPLKSLEPVATVSHSEWRPFGGCARDDVRRFVRVGRYFLSVSAYGYKVHDPECSFRELVARPFVQTEYRCSLSGEI